MSALGADIFLVYILLYHQFHAVSTQCSHVDTSTVWFQ